MTKEGREEYKFGKFLCYSYVAKIQNLCWYVMFQNLALKSTVSTPCKLHGHFSTCGGHKGIAQESVVVEPVGAS